VSTAERIVAALAEEQQRHDRGDLFARPSITWARELGFITEPIPDRDPWVHHDVLAIVGYQGAEISEDARQAGGQTSPGLIPSTSGAGPDAGATLAPSRVDLVKLIREGIPEREYLPGGEGWLVRGKRYLVYASGGVGKSLGLLVVAVEAAVRGTHVAILDLENGADEYARRLETIIAGREEVATACAERLRYFEYPPLSLAWSEQEWIAALGDSEIVVFDSSRISLSSVGLSEDVNDDYAKFINRLVTPLSHAGVTTVILDNSGHEGGHPRGASAKVDLNEIVYELRAASPFEIEQTGELAWRCTRQRFSGIPRTMRQRLGGGIYEVPQPEDASETVNGRFRPTFLMERVSRYIENFPGRSQRALREAGLGKRTETVTQALRVLVDEGYVSEDTGGKSRTSRAYRSLTPYRRDNDAQSGADEGDEEE
jgi:hypothetical protein